MRLTRKNAAGEVECKACGRRTLVATVTTRCQACGHEKDNTCLALALMRGPLGRLLRF